MTLPSASQEGSTARAYPPPSLHRKECTFLKYAPLLRHALQRSTAVIANQGALVQFPGAAWKDCGGAQLIWKNRNYNL